jgi:hypothetical protein
MALDEQSLKDFRKKLRREMNGSSAEILPRICWQNENDRLIRQAFFFLQSGLVAVPLVAGLDKFFNVLGNWPTYLAPGVLHLFAGSPTSVMGLVGIVEVVLALGMILWPRLFSALLMIWICLIIGNLLLLGQHLDIVLRDFGFLAALAAFWRLSLIKEVVPVKASEPEPRVFSIPALARLRLVESKEDPHLFLNDSKESNVIHPTARKCTLTSPHIPLTIDRGPNGAPVYLLNREEAPKPHLV